MKPKIIREITNPKTIKHFMKTKFSHKELVDIISDAVIYIGMIDKNRGKITISYSFKFDLSGWNENSDW